MTKHPIPLAALDDRHGYIGTSGSGKTYNAGSAVERVLDHHGRAIICDPLGVWWGLRLLSDGKTPSPYDVVIFGGPHGDLPLNEHAGALIGETVAGMAESCILDLSELGTKAAERRFMLGFLTALYRHTGGSPLHLVLDEVDMFAPQQPRDREGEAIKLLGMVETIVRRGRIKGFIPWLISQRPAVVNKDVLSMVDGLIAFKLTSSQDRDALEGWVEGQADRQQWKDIRAVLPTLDPGQGVVWLPSRSILDTVSFPPKKTFDSSRAPKRGEKQARTAPLKPLDVDRLKARLASVVEEVKANDPRELKAEIARLKKQMSDAAAAAARQGATPDPAALEEAEKRGFVAGVAQHREQIVGVFSELENAWREYNAQGDLMTKTILRVLHTAQADLGYRAGAVPRPPQPVPPITVSLSRGDRTYGVRTSRANGGTSEKLPRVERRVLTALAQYPQGRTKNQVAVLTGYAVNGGGFNNGLSALRSAGRIEDSGDRLVITADGLDALGTWDPLPIGAALLQHWLGQLGRAERAALEVLARQWPNGMSKELVAVNAGYEANGGGFNNALSRLRTLELISGRGELKASDELFGS